MRYNSVEDKITPDCVNTEINKIATLTGLPKSLVEKILTKYWNGDVVQDPSNYYNNYGQGLFSPAVCRQASFAFLISGNIKNKHGRWNLKMLNQCRFTEQSCTVSAVAD